MSGTLIQDLAAIVGPAGVLTGSDAAAYEHGARYGHGRALCVVRPATADEVSRAVALCAAAGVRVVPQGANTGLVGASTPDGTGSQVILALERLRACCEIDAADRTVTVDAGVTLSALNERLQPHGLWFPIDLGADPQVGGMVATNTGGTRLLRHGDVRRNLLAVEAVLFDPPGARVRLGRGLRKDNTGLDLKQLFVGTAGMAGVVTRAVLEVQPQPRQTATALIAPVDEDAVLALLQSLEHELGDFLSAFEGISATALRAAVAHVPGLRLPFDGALPEFTLLVELSATGSPQASGLDLQEALNRLLQSHFDTLVADAVLGSGEALWRLRHSLSDGARGLGHPIAFDVAVPRSRLMAFRRAGKALVARHWPELIVCDFGHVGDGGVHFNLAWPPTASTPYDDAAVAELREKLYRLTVEEFGGTFSAEHGLGPHNASCHARFAGERASALTGALQQLLDPHRVGGGLDLRTPAGAAREESHA